LATRRSQPASRRFSSSAAFRLDIMNTGSKCGIWSQILSLLISKPSFGRTLRSNPCIE
jgi:hypothetical protein